MASDSKRDQAAGRFLIDRRKFLSTAASGLALSGVSAVAPWQASARDNAGANEQSPRHRKDTLFPFAAAFPPKAEGLFPTADWLGAVHAAGYTHVILQTDPFFHDEMDLSLQDRGGSIFQFLSVFDIAAGPSHKAYQAWLSAVSEKVSRNGLKLAMELWEPYASQFIWQMLPSEWQGPEGEFCVSQVDARMWLLRGFQAVLKAAPALEAVALGTLDNRARLCSDKCPRCASKPLAQRMGDMYRDIDVACAEVRSSFHLIPYNWWWPDAYYDAIYSRARKGTPILTRVQRGADYTPDPEHPEWTGNIYDQSLACDEVGPDFPKAKKTVETYHGGPVIVMPTLSGMFEAYELPYVPAVGQVAKKFDQMRRLGAGGWWDYDDGGIHQGLILDLVKVVQHDPDASVEEWISSLSEERYGSREAATTAMQAWDAWDRAVRAMPTVLSFKSIDVSSGRIGNLLALTPMHPFLPERAKRASDTRDDPYWYDPHNLLTPEAIPAFRHCLRRALTLAKEGLALCQQVAAQTPDSCRANAERDAELAELVVLLWQSNANFIEWGASVQGDKSVPFADVVRAEIEVTRRYQKMQMRPELEVGNMVYNWRRQLSYSAPEAATDTHRRSYNSLSCSPLPGFVPTRRFDDAVGDWYAWKIKSLEQQLQA
jgi:hypothetical protein